MVRAVVGGREFDLTKDDIIRTMRHVQPEPIREHFVVIGEKPFPPKQALAQVTGWDRQTFTSMEAIRVLTRVGFKCVRRADGRPAWDPEDPGDLREHPEDSRQQPTSPADRRLSALESAVTVIQEAIAGLTKRVHELERKASA
jgi:hypothetical protein